MGIVLFSSEVYPYAAQSMVESSWSVTCSEVKFRTDMRYSIVCSRLVVIGSGAGRRISVGFDTTCVGKMTLMNKNDKQQLATILFLIRAVFIKDTSGI